MIKRFSWLDFKLGIRMLLKYPWLAIVGGLGMAVAVAIGASFFGIIYSMMDPTVPLPHGERIVTVQLWNDSTRSPQRRILSDFFFWRSRITTMDEVGAYLPAFRNVVTPQGDPEPMPVAEITASGFRTAGIAPVRGRYLQDSDEAANAPPVAVIGEEIWRERYHAAGDVLGQEIQIGRARYRIVGVMPQKFGWPLHHQLWIPLQLRPDEFAAGTGPIVHAFGRLKPNVSIETAQRELAQIGQQMAAARPQTHARTRPTVLPYTFPYVDVDSISMSWAFHALQLSITLLLVLVCANVATLIYARTATRQGEIAVRTALGASRRRIVSQLFVEALVLAVFASIAGLTMAKLALHQINVFFQESLGGEIPFWMRPEVSTGVVMYTALVTVLAATIVGALPAWKATGRRVQAQLRQLGGGSGLVLGRTWTVLIIAQVAFAVAILPVTLHNTWEFATFGLGGPGFEADRYLFGVLTREDNTSAADDPLGREQSNRALLASQARLMERLRAEEMIAGATYSWRLPGQESAGMIEVEGVAPPKDSTRYSMGGGSRNGHLIKTNRVPESFFPTFGVTLQQGRLLTAGDSTADVVLVNQAFANRLLPGQDVVGRRFRYVGRGADSDSINIPIGRWFQIVGVVSNFPAKEMQASSVALRVYHPPVPGRGYAMTFARMADGYEAANFAGRLKAITASVDPTLQLSDVRSLKVELMEEQRMMRLSAVALITLSISVLLLSAAGIYSLMSLTVNQRRREIGIRSALGAYPRNIMGAVFKRATRQLASGVLIGIILVFVVDALSRGLLLQGRAPALLPLVAAIMAGVGLLAAWGPARRGLRIQPTEALRDL